MFVQMNVLLVTTETTVQDIMLKLKEKGYELKGEWCPGSVGTVRKSPVLVCPELGYHTDVPCLVSWQDACDTNGKELRMSDRIPVGTLIPYVDTRAAT